MDEDEGEEEVNEGEEDHEEGETEENKINSPPPYAEHREEHGNEDEDEIGKQRK